MFHYLRREFCNYPHTDGAASATLAEGHFDNVTAGVGNGAADPPIGGRCALPSY